MSKLKKANQEFPPTSKKKRVDSLGNDRRKLYLKDGGTTFTFVKNITEGQSKFLKKTIEDVLATFNLKHEGQLLWKP